MAATSTTKPAAPAERKEDGYNWKNMHEDYENGKYTGVYGGANAAWHGLAEIRANVTISDYHKKRSADEFYVPHLDKHIKNEHTRRRWNEICSIDPLGMYAHPPTMASVESSVNIPELTFTQGDAYGIVNADGSANVTKLAIDYVWDVPRVAARLGMDETRFRKAMQTYCQNDKVVDPKTRLFLPPLGGATVYIFGDATLLGKETTEVAVRVHDSCCGSDVFGTDICTCRPYLVFAIKAAVECAQRGGVGLIVYFQKEGRSLGEVTKFRVYNARKAQKGGDTAENYFYQTESIAGIRDARFQEMMADSLVFLGITRIDWLLSMSADKYDAITGAGIKVMQRVALPDIYVPRNAHVEINAKIAAGYHTDAVESNRVVGDLRSLEMIRARCGQIYSLAEQGKLQHFTLDQNKIAKAAEFVIGVMKKNYPDVSTIPYHSRWRHFSGEGDVLLKSWQCDEVEKSRRMMDLVTISVLLDAGAGPTYHYVDPEGKRYTRSEGLAMASLDMFREGNFSSDVAIPHRVNSHGLKSLTQHMFERGFQLSKNNVVVGAAERFKLLQRLGTTLELPANNEFFGKECYRPGNIVDYVLRNAVTNANDGKKHVSVKVLWRAVIEGYETIWPENLSGVRRGDVWVYNPLKKIGEAASDMIPFHKLSQWLTYSLLEPIERLGVVVDDLDALTGLAEYRNGGLFIDLGVLTPKSEPSYLEKMQFDIGSELIVEWRACTVVLLDKTAEIIRKQLNLTAAQLPLAKVLQGGTWAAGRVIAAEKRKDGSPPLNVRSDGTVF